jgi:hypothetical protein
MSTDPTAQAGAPISGDPSGQTAQPSEEELRAAYEAELSRVTSTDMILQATVSLLNLAGRRLGLAPGAEGERDLEQVRDAVDGVRALLEILERSAPVQELRPLRDALSQLQMAYAREAQAGADAGGGGADPQQGQPAGRQSAPTGAAKPDAPAPGAEGAAQDKPGAGGGAAPAEKPEAGPAESSGRLWVPGR